MTAGGWKTPIEKDELKWADTTVGIWEKIAPDSSGWFKGPYIKKFIHLF